MENQDNSDRERTSPYEVLRIGINLCGYVKGNVLMSTRRLSRDQYRQTAEDLYKFLFTKVKPVYHELLLRLEGKEITDFDITSLMRWQEDIKLEREYCGLIESLLKFMVESHKMADMA